MGERHKDRQTRALKLCDEPERAAHARRVKHRDERIRAAFIAERFENNLLIGANGV